MVKKDIMRKKFIKALIFLMFLLFICISIFLYFYITQNSNSQKQIEYINSSEWNGELYPDGMPNLYRNYSGQLTCQNIGKSFYYVTNTVIPKYAKECKNYNEEDLEKYFEDNKEDIALDVGIKKVEDFCSLINKINESITKDEIEFEKFYIDSESVEVRSGKTKANLCIKYKDCDELILNIRINNTKVSNVSSVKYE